MPDGSFDVQSLLAQGAQGKAVPPGYTAFPGGGGETAAGAATNDPATWQRWVSQDTKAPSTEQPQSFDVLGLLHSGTQGKATTPPPAPEAGTLSGIGKNLGAGLVEGGEGVLNTLSDPVGNLVGRPLSVLGGYAYDAIAPHLGGKALTPEQWASLRGEDEPPQIGQRVGAAVGQALGAPSLESVQATTGAEEAARRVGQALIGGGALGPRAVLPAVAGNLTGQAASAAVPDYWKPGADLAGQILGAGAAGAGADGVRAAAGAAKRLVFGRPAEEAVGRQLMEAGGPESLTKLQEMQAAQQRIGEIDARLSQPDVQPAEQTALQAERSDLVPRSMQIVPGSQPTLGEATFNPKLAALEQSMRVQNGEPFAARAREQNTARLAALGGQASEAASPASVASLFTGRLQALENAQTAETGAAAAARETAGGAPLGGLQRPEDYGEQMRAAIVPPQQASKAAAQRLLNAVDPQMNLNIAPAKAAAKEVIKSVVPVQGIKTAVSLDPQVASVAQALAQAPDVVPFGWLRDQRMVVGDIKRGLLRGQGSLENIPGRHASILGSGIDDAINEAVERAISAEHASEGVSPLEQRLTTALSEIAAREGAGEGAISAEAGGAGGTSPRGATGAGVAAEGGPGGVEGSEGVARPALTEDISPENAAAYRQGNQRYREYKETYRNGPTGAVLAQDQTNAYRIPDVSVPRKFFTSGDTNPAAVQAYIKATGGSEKALATARDYLVSELRHDGVIDANTGAVDEKAFNRWRQRREPALAALGGDLRTRLSNAVEAQRLYDETVAKHETAIREFQRGVAANFLKDEPEVAISKALSAKDPQAFQRLASAVKGNADATEGLKRAVVDWMLKRFEGAGAATETENFLQPRMLQKWVDANKPALRSLFGGQGMQTFEMVAADLRRQQQRVEAVSGSQTASRLAAGKRLGTTPQGQSVLRFLMGEGIGHLAGHLLGFGTEIGGGLGGAASFVGHALKQLGVERRADLLREAMLNPDLARTLMEKVVEGKEQPGLWRRVATRLLAASAANQATHRQEKQ